MNRKVNAIVHRMPECPECGAAPLKPCVTMRGLTTERHEPHDIRIRMKEGEVFVLWAADARAVNKLRAVRELDAVVNARNRARVVLGVASLGLGPRKDAMPAKATRAEPVAARKAR